MDLMRHARLATQRAAAAGLAATLVACGGGGSGGGGSGGATGFTIGGTLVNYTGRALVLRNNGGDAITVAGGATSFTFPTSVAGGTAYAVTIDAQPIGQDCTIANASGTANASVSSVTVTCGVMAPLALTASNPPDGATDVSRTVVPVLTFAQRIDPATVNDGSVAITGDDESPPTAATVTGNAVSLAPTLPKLLPLARYQVQAGPAVRGLRGESRAGTDTRSFTTRDAAWQDPAVPGTGTYRDEPSVALTDGGNAIAVWQQAVNGLSRLYASRFVAARGVWETPAPIDTTIPAGVGAPMVGVDAQGAAVVAWLQSEDSGLTVRTSQLAAGDSTWESSRRISLPTDGSVQELRLAVSPLGGAMLVWTQSDGQRSRVRASRMDLGGAWTDPTPLDTGAAALAFSPRVALDRTGNGVAAWLEFDGVGSRVYASRWWMDGSARSWSTPLPLQTQAGYVYSPVEVSIGQGRTGYAVWKQPLTDGAGTTRDVIRASWFDGEPGAGHWSPDFSVSPQSQSSVDLPQVAATDYNDGGIFVWTQLDGNRSRLWSARVEGAQAPAAMPAMVTEGDSTGSQLRLARLVADRRGNALLLFKREAGTTVTVWSGRWPRASAEWLAPVPLGETAGLATTAITPSINNWGDVVAAWPVPVVTSSGKRTDVQVRRFE